MMWCVVDVTVCEVTCIGGGGSIGVEVYKRLDGDSLVCVVMHTDAIYLLLIM